MEDGGWRMRETGEQRARMQSSSRGWAREQQRPRVQRRVYRYRACVNKQRRGLGGRALGGGESATGSEWTDGRGDEPMGGGRCSERGGEARA